MQKEVSSLTMEENKLNEPARRMRKTRPESKYSSGSSTTYFDAPSSTDQSFVTAAPFPSSHEYIPNKSSIINTLLKKAPTFYKKQSKPTVHEPYNIYTESDKSVPKVKRSSREILEYKIQRSEQSTDTSKSRSFVSFRNIVPKAVYDVYNQNESILKLRRKPMKPLQESKSFGDLTVGPKYREHKEKPKRFWITTEIARSLHKGLYLQDIAVQELSIFLIYLIVLSTITWNINVSQRMHMEKGLKRHFENFDAHNKTILVEKRRKTIFDCKTPQYVYEYINTTWIFAGWSDYYHGVKKTHVQKSTEVSWAIVGTFRVRQLRVPFDQCTPGANFDGVPCFSYYDSTYQDQSTPLPKTRKRRSVVVDLIARARGESGIVHLSDEELTEYLEEYVPPDRSSVPEETLIAWYPSGGYVVKFSRGKNSRAKNKQMLDSMVELNYIDRRTRAVFIEAVVFNPNVNLMTEVKVLFEFSPTGVVKPKIFVRPVVVFAHYDINDSFLMGCFYVVVIFTVLYVCEEIREIVFFKVRYVTRFWSYIDWIIIYYVFIARMNDIYINYEIDKILEFHKENPLEYLEVGRLIEKVYAYEYSLAMATLFGFFKLLRYWLYFFNAEAFWMTLWDVSESLSVFFVHFGYLFFGFTVLGTLLFGTFVREFSSIPATTYTLIRMVIGYFDYNNLVREHLHLGRIYFLMAFFLMMIPILAFSLAMFSHWYTSNARETLHFKGLTFERIWCRIKRKFYQYRNLPHDHLTKRELKDALLAMDFTEPEIDLFFHMYKVNPKYSSDPALAICYILEMKSPIKTKRSQSVELDRKVSFSAEFEEIITDPQSRLGESKLTKSDLLSKPETSEEILPERLDWLRGLLQEQVTKLGVCSCTSLCSCTQLEKDIFDVIKQSQGLDQAADSIVSGLEKTEAQLVVDEIIAEALANLDKLIAEMIESGVAMADRMEAEGLRTGGRREVERMVSSAVVDAMIEKLSDKIGCSCGQDPCACSKRAQMVDTGVPCSCGGNPPCTCSKETAEMKAKRREERRQKRLGTLPDETGGPGVGEGVIETTEENKYVVKDIESRSGDFEGIEIKTSETKDVEGGVTEMKGVTEDVQMVPSVEGGRQERELISSKKGSVEEATVIASIEDDKIVPPTTTEATKVAEDDQNVPPTTIEATNVAEDDKDVPPTTIETTKVAEDDKNIPTTKIETTEVAEDDKNVPPTTIESSKVTEVDKNVPPTTSTEVIKDTTVPSSKSITKVAEDDKNVPRTTSAEVVKEVTTEPTTEPTKISDPDVPPTTSAEVAKAQQPDAEIIKEEPAEKQGEKDEIKDTVGSKSDVPPDVPKTDQDPKAPTTTIAYTTATSPLIIQLRNSIQTIVHYAIEKTNEDKAFKKVEFRPDPGRDLIEIQPEQPKVKEESVPMLANREESFSRVVTKPKMDKIWSDVGKEFLDENDPVKVKSQLSGMLEKATSDDAFIKKILSGIIVKIQKDLTSSSSEVVSSSDDIQTQILKDTLGKPGGAKLAKADILAEKKIADISGFNVADPKSKTQLKSQALTRLQFEELQIKIDRLELVLETAVERVHTIVAMLRRFRELNRETRAKVLRDEQDRLAEKLATSVSEAAGGETTSTDEEKFRESFAEKMNAGVRKTPAQTDVLKEDVLEPIPLVDIKQSEKTILSVQRSSPVPSAMIPPVEIPVVKPVKEQPKPPILKPSVETLVEKPLIEPPVVKTTPEPPVLKPPPAVTAMWLEGKSSSEYGSTMSRRSSGSSLISQVESRMRRSSIDVIYEEQTERVGTIQKSSKAFSIIDSTKGSDSKSRDKDSK